MYSIQYNQINIAKLILEKSIDPNFSIGNDQILY